MVVNEDRSFLETSPQRSVKKLQLFFYHIGFKPRSWNANLNFISKKV